MKLDQREKTILLTLVILIGVLGIVIGLSLGLTRDRKSHDDPADSSTLLSKNTTASTSTASAPAQPSTTSSPSYTTSPSDVGYDSTYKKYRFAAVTTDTEICSQIGVLADSLFFLVVLSFSL